MRIPFPSTRRNRIVVVVGLVVVIALVCTALVQMALGSLWAYTSVCTVCGRMKESRSFEIAGIDWMASEHEFDSRMSAVVVKHGLYDGHAHRWANAGGRTADGGFACVFGINATRRMVADSGITAEAFDRVASHVAPEEAELWLDRLLNSDDAGLISRCFGTAVALDWERADFDVWWRTLQRDIDKRIASGAMP